MCVYLHCMGTYGCVVTGVPTLHCVEGNRRTIAVTAVVRG